MLHIVRPNEHRIYKDMIAEMFAHLNSESSKNAWQKDMFDTPDTTYCLYIDDRFGLVGSARLLPRPTLLADYIQTEENEEGYWECNRVFFDIPEDDPIHEDPEAFNGVTERFYQELFDGIKNLARNSGIKTMVLVNPIDEHEDIVFFGRWPFEIESLVDIEASGSVSTFAVGGCRF